MATKTHPAMKPLQKVLRGVTYILVDQCEAYQECKGCAFVKRGDLCEEIGDECNTPETIKMVWEVKKERI
jgi:hypothetical protein